MTFDGSPAQVREELDLLHSALEEGHPALYESVTRGKLDSLFAQALTDSTVSLRDYQLSLCRLVARIGDGHTQVLMPKDSLDRLDESATAFPFRVAVIGGELFVDRNLSDVPDSEFLGARIDSINGHPTTEFIATAVAISSSDGANRTNPIRRLGAIRLMTRSYACIYGITRSYRIRYTPYQARLSRTRTLAGISFDEVLSRMRERYPSLADRPPASLSYETGARAALLRIRDFDQDHYRESKLPFSVFLDTTFASLSRRQISTLILDLRSNRGGTDEYGKLVAAHLIDHDFLYYRSMTMKKLSYDFFAHTTNAKGFRAPHGFARANTHGTYDVIAHPNVGIQAHSASSYRGRLLVLIDGACFSTTSELLSALAEYTSAEFVGEESGGAFRGNCSGPTPTLELPYSRMRIDLPIVRYEMAVSGDRPRDRGILPDVPVVSSVEDILTGRDSVLESARAMIGARPDSATITSNPTRTRR
ncbi:MAG: S41 family peptidase [Candidatus Eisenbacteria bacterium]